MINLDIDSLRTFVTLADNQSFTLTASCVARTQSTVSAQIKKLEERLGFVLFERDRRNFSVTSKGEALLRYAREVLRIHDEGVKQVTSEEIRGAIRVGITDYFVPRALPDLLVQFRRSYPAAQVEVTCGLTGELLAKKKNGEIDIVVGRRDATDSSVRNQNKLLVLRREKLFWVGPKGATRMSARSAPVDPLPLVLLPVGCGVRAHAAKALTRARRRWYVAYCGQSVSALQGAISAGLGIGALTEGSLNTELCMLGKREGLPPLIDSEIVLHPAVAASSEIDALTDLLVAHFERAPKN